MIPPLGQGARSPVEHLTRPAAAASAVAAVAAVGQGVRETAVAGPLGPS